MLSKVVVAVGLTPELVAAVTEDFVRDSKESLKGPEAKSDRKASSSNSDGESDWSDQVATCLVHATSVNEPFVSAQMCRLSD